MTTFRSQAIATLKQAKEQGYTVTCKLTASNAQLHAALVALDEELECAEYFVGEDITINRQLQAAAKARIKLHTEGVDNMTDEELNIAEVTSEDMVKQEHTSLVNLFNTLEANYKAHLQQTAALGTSVHDYGLLYASGPARPDSFTRLIAHIIGTIGYAFLIPYYWAVYGVEEWQQRVDSNPTAVQLRKQIGQYFYTLGYIAGHTIKGADWVLENTIMCGTR